MSTSHPFARAYCLQADGTWTPPVALSNAAEGFLYCTSHHEETDEIRIIDADDFIVLHMQDHVLYIPDYDGSFLPIPLTPEGIERIRHTAARKEYAP